MIKSSDWKTMNNPSNPWVDFFHLHKSCSSPHTAPAHQYRTGAFASLKLYATVSFNSRLMSCQQWKGFSTPILYPWIPKHIQQSPPPPPSHQGILIAAGRGTRFTWGYINRRSMARLRRAIYGTSQVWYLTQRYSETQCMEQWDMTKHVETILWGLNRHTMLQVQKKEYATS